MSEQDDALVASRVDGAVALVDGVSETYSARPVVARAVRRLADADDARSLVRRADAGWDVTVSIGAAEQDDAAEVAARVAVVARAEAGADAPVTVRVSRFVRRD